jgi:uncharacterized cupin superfamily protein
MSTAKLHLAPALDDIAWEPIAPDKILAGAPATKTWVQYEELGGKLASGQWAASPGKWRISYAEWEHVVMIFGRCVIEGDDGSRIEAGPGDAFVIEPGFNGSWEVLEPMRKHWVIEER